MDDKSSTQKDKYFDHDADIGIQGDGHTLEAAFVDAAKTTFALMTDLSAIHPDQSIQVAFEESDIELALVKWLNALLGEARSHGLVFCQFELKHTNQHWQGLAWGQPWQMDTERGTEVKGATLTMLSVSQHNGQWHAQCVVDV